MDIEQLTSRFATNEKVTEFIKMLRERHGLSDYYYAPGSDDHLEAREALIEAGVELEIDDFMRETILEADDEPILRTLLMPVDKAKQIPVKLLIEQVAIQLIDKVPDSMTMQDLLANEAFGWIFKAILGDPKELILDLTITGEAKPLSNDFLGKIETLDLFGDKLIIAAVHEMTDIEKFVEELKEKHRELFGFKKATPEKKNILRDTFFEGCFKQGMKNRQIAELWVEREPKISPGYTGGPVSEEDIKRLINAVKQARHRFKAQ